MRKHEKTKDQNQEETCRFQLHTQVLAPSCVTSSQAGGREEEAGGREEEAGVHVMMWPGLGRRFGELVEQLPAKAELCRE